MRTHTTLFALSALLLSAVPIAAQQGLDAGSADTISKPAKIDSAAAAAAEASLVPPSVIQRLRPRDQRGLNTFEAPKHDAVPFTGFQLGFGAAFTQQFQGLDHENAAAPRVVNGVDQNRLMDIGRGFNNATANLYLNAQLAPGIRVALTSYLSSRHHNETWVKDGYLLVDESPLEVAALERLMDYVTLKLGHFEVNYGDAHFRRTDNGNALANPFVGNLILDAFTTEIGGEVYVRANGLLAMVGVTGGEIRGNVKRPGDRAPALLAKLGVDRQLAPRVRARLTGSAYRASKSPGSTLYAGDRAGSRYYLVVENTAATEAANFSSGLLNPGFNREVTALMLNPFVKAGGLELFGVAERATGRAYQTGASAGLPEAADRAFTQYAADAVYRFLPGERVYVGGRYNAVEGEFAGLAAKAGADRYALSGGWFITPTVLLKGEWVRQRYSDFPATDIRHGAKFSGFVMEGVVAF